jgi:hypothetical protein
MPPCPTSTASRCWPCTRGQSAAAPASPTRGHWKALPDGHTRATTTSGEAFTAAGPGDDQAGRRSEPAGALRFLLARADAAQVTVGHRPLSVYDQITGTRPFTTVPATDPEGSA